MIRASALLTALFTPAMVAALELPHGAKRASEEFAPLASYAVPTTAWTTDGIKTIVAEGRVIREAWHLTGQATTLELLAPLRTQLTDQGYEILFECETQSCGGFDFRYETDVISEPEMHVNLGDFRFISAQRDSDEGSDYVTLLVSRSSSTGYVQFVKVTPSDTAPTTEADLATKSPSGLAVMPSALPSAITSFASEGIAADLERIGRTILSDLSFETGSSRLTDTTFASLDELATYLRENPERKVTLVGHTDASGSLDANIALSRSRARAVQERLISTYDIPGAQLEADGVGYLMPLASNLTDEGRAANRRVEVVLNSTE